MAAFAVYRSSTLGQALESTVDSMIQDQLIPPHLKQKVMSAFDKSINKHLSQKARNKMTFKADKLRSYRYCDNVWTFLMERVEFRDGVEGPIQRVKIVACDGSTKQTL